MRSLETGLLTAAELIYLLPPWLNLSTPQVTITGVKGYYPPL